MSNSMFITFYSYKGGVGRTQALANTAVSLANRGRNVVVVDMDLESPGLHNFFYPEDRALTPFSFRDEDFVDRPGVIDFVEECSRLPAEEPKIQELLVPCTHPNVKPGMGWIRLLPAGRLSDDYPARIGAFSWERFYEKQEGYRFLELLRHRLIQTGADYVLVDSRTGMTDIANICTFQLPDVVVVLFALHEQGIEGAFRAAQAIQRASQEVGAAARPQRVLLVPSRVEESGDHVSRDEWVLRARDRLSGTGTLLAELGQRIPYAAEFAHGETIVVDAGEPSNLSRAYERLLEEIVGTPRPASIPAPARPSFKELRADLDRLEQNVLALILELQSTVLTVRPLAQLRRFAYDVFRKRNSLLDEARKLRKVLRLLAVESGTEPERTPEVEVGTLETAEDWKGVVIGLRRALDAQITLWIAVQRRRIEEKLLESAEQDAALVVDALGELQPWLEGGELQEIDARLPAIAEALARHGLESLLRRDALNRDRFTRSRPDPVAQVTWLDERLQRLLAEGAFDPDLQPMLANLLRLRTETSDAPTHLHWSAYELLCDGVQQDPVAAEHAFDAIGHWLWSRAWDGILTGTIGVEHLRGLAGPEAKKNLELVLRVPSITGASLKQRISDGLLRLWNEGKGKLAKEIVARRRDDAGVRAALEMLLSANAPPRARRELLATWLQGGDIAERDAPILQSYVEALVEEEYDAEAFYALEAFREIGVANGLDGGSIYVAFLLLALKRGRGELIEALLMDTEIRDRIAALRAGKALFVLLVWQSGRFSKEVRSAFSFVRQAIEHADANGATLPPDLAVLVEEPIDFDISSVHTIRDLEHRIREEFQTNRFRGNWEASRLYEADFHAHVGDRLDALLRSESPRDLEMAAQQDAWDAEEWIQRSYKLQREKGLRTSVPEGAARRSIISAFSDAQERFLDLARLRPSVGTPSLVRVINAGSRVATAGRRLRDWLFAAPPANRLERRLAEDVGRMIEDAKEET